MAEATGSGIHNIYVRSWDFFLGAEQCYLVYMMVMVPSNTQIRFETSYVRNSNPSVVFPITQQIGYTKGEFVPVLGVVKLPPRTDHKDSCTVYGTAHILNAQEQDSYTAAGEKVYIGTGDTIPISLDAYNAFTANSHNEYAAKYVSLDPIAPVTNPYIHSMNGNLIPPFHMAIQRTPTAAIKNYQWYNIAGGTDDFTTIPIDVMPNTDYILKVGQISGARHAVYPLDVNTVNPPSGWTTGDTITFNSGINTRLLYPVSSTDPASVVGQLRDPMLVKGSTPKPFKPREDSLLIFNTKLRANPRDGGNPDELICNDGSYYKIKRWAEVPLEVGRMPGAPQWSAVDTQNWNGHFLFKVTLPIPAAPWTTPYVYLPYEKRVVMGTKYYSNIDAYFENGTFVWRTDEQNWGEGYVPTQQEIDAFILGWGMYDTSTTKSGTRPYKYDRTDGLYKGWYPIADYLNESARVTTVPVGPAPGWVPITVLYEQAAITVEPVPTYGALSLEEGATLVKVGSGAVIREKIPTVVSGAETVFRVKGLKDSYTQYPPDKIIATYVDGYDNTAAWRYEGQISSSEIINLSGVGVGGRMYSMGFDKEADHRITYIPFYNAPAPDTLTITYPTSEKAMLQAFSTMLRRQQEIINELRIVERSST